LNGHGRFAAAAFSPVVLNSVMILALVYAYLIGAFESERAGLIASAAITVAGVLQLLALSWSLKRAGITLHWKRPRWTANVKRLLQLAGPSVVAGGVVQINVIVGTIIASTQAGAISWLYYADRLYQLPLGIVGIAIGVVLLPELARALRGGRLDVARHTQNRSIEFAAALTLPASIALFVIPAPIIAILFERGAFSAADTAATAPALAAYAVGLPAFVAIKVLQPGYFAREDTRTPMIYGAISMLVNVGAALALFPVAGHVGIAAATSIAAWINVAMLIWTLRRREQLVADAALKRRLPLLGLASIAMGLALYGALFALAPYLDDGRTLVRLAVLAVLVGGGFAVFVLFSQMIGAIDLKALWSGLKRKAPPPPPPGS
jgi:putative peptidoglycan lipid II flippase